MPSNYTFNASMSCSASSATGYSQSQSGSFNLSLTQINQVESGRNGKIVYIRNLDKVNFLEVHSGTAVDTHVIAILEPEEWFFTIVRDDAAIGASADTAAIDVEYFSVEIDSEA